MVSIANVKPVQELLAAVLIKPQYFGILATSATVQQHCQCPTRTLSKYQIRTGIFVKMTTRVSSIHTLY